MISFQKEECDQGVVVPNWVENLTGETVDLQPHKKAGGSGREQTCGHWERVGRIERIALKCTHHRV